MFDLHKVGGTPAVFKALLQAGLLHGGCITVNGKTFSRAADNSNGDNTPAGPLATIDPSLLPPFLAGLLPN